MPTALFCAPLPAYVSICATGNPVDLDPRRIPGMWNNSPEDTTFYYLHRYWSLVEFEAGEPIASHPDHPVTTLSQNYPNPFNPTTEIAFSLAAASHVRLEVFNIMGQRVALLADDQFSAGTHSTEWNSTNEAGSRVASGIYFYRLTTQDMVATKKMILLK